MLALREVKRSVGAALLLRTVTGKTRPLLGTQFRPRAHEPRNFADICRSDLRKASHTAGHSEKTHPGLEIIGRKKKGSGLTLLGARPSADVDSSSSPGSRSSSSLSPLLDPRSVASLSLLSLFNTQPGWVDGGLRHLPHVATIFFLDVTLRRFYVIRCDESCHGRQLDRASADKVIK